MTSLWIRVDVSLESDRLFQRLDGYGRAAIQLMWRIAKKGDGYINRSDFDDTDYIAGMLGFSDHPEAVRIALDRCVELGMLTHEGDRVRVPAWHRYQSTSAERQRKYREKLNDNQKPVTHVTDVTQQTNKQTNKQTDKYSGDFEKFYSSYPNKKGKKNAYKAYLKAAKEQDWPGLEKVLQAVKAHTSSKDWTKDGGEYIPHPATWLNGGRWADDIDGAPRKKLKRFGG